MQIVRSPEQAELAARLVRPAREELLRLARAHREAVDADLRSELAAGHPVPNAPNPSEGAYPHGFCFAICARVFERLSKEPLVQGFVAAGVIWKTVYFIQHGRLFQNAVQCGDDLLDAANNTCSPEFEPVVCSPLEEVNWENLRDYRQTATVAEKYYKARLFPNRFFPLLFPVAPFLRLGEGGDIAIFWHEHLLFFQDINEGWPRVGALLDDAPWMGQPLPAPHAARMRELQRAAGSGAPPPVELRECSPDELRASLASWEALHELPTGSLRRTITNLDFRLRSTARWLLR
jgi:hypothetical protein